MIVVVIADEATIKSLDKYKGITAELTDPRKLPEARRETARSPPGSRSTTATGTLHSPETGSAEMLMELAYRLAVEETPFIQAIRDNVIVLLTPVLEVDGREKLVDTFYYQKKTGKTLPLVVLGQVRRARQQPRRHRRSGLKLTENVLRTFLDWHPTVLHDLHESMPYLYASTGTGPYNTCARPDRDRRVVAPGEVRGRAR